MIEPLARLERDDPGVVQLATAVSLAVVVDPTLLRSARLILTPGVDAGAEQRLWFSELVERRGQEGFLFLRDARQALHRRLRADRELLTRAWNLTKEQHSELAPAVVLEERVTWMTLAGSSQATIDAELTKVVRAIRGGRSGLSSWAAKAIERLPRSAINGNPARWLGATAAVTQGGLRSTATTGASWRRQSRPRSPRSR